MVNDTSNLNHDYTTTNTYLGLKSDPEIRGKKKVKTFSPEAEEFNKIPIAGISLKYIVLR